MSSPVRPLDIPSSPRQVPLTHSQLIKKRRAGTLTEAELTRLHELDAASAARHRQRARQAEAKQAARPAPSNAPAVQVAETPEEIAEHERRIAEQRAFNIAETKRALGITDASPVKADIQVPEKDRLPEQVAPDYSARHMQDFYQFDAYNASPTPEPQGDVLIDPFFVDP